MDYKQISKIMFDSIKQKHNIALERDPDGKSIGHLLWMLNELINWQKSDDKANRWIGYAQALANIHGLYTLDELKDLNR